LAALGHSIVFRSGPPEAIRAANLRIRRHDLAAFGLGLLPSAGSIDNLLHLKPLLSRQTMGGTRGKQDRPICTALKVT